MSHPRYYIIVTPFFPTHDSFRGPFIYDQVKALMRVRDYEVVVFKPTSLSDKRRYYEYDGIKVYLFPMLQSPSYLFNGSLNGLNTWLFIKRFRQTGIDPFKVEAIHCHTSSFGALGLGLKKLNKNITVLLQHHDKDPFTILNGKFADWKLNSRYRASKNIKIFNSVDAHVCISEACKANLESFPNASPKETYEPYLNRLKKLKGLPSIKPKNIVLLYNGVDLTKFYKYKTQHENDLVIGCIANFIPLKGQKDLINAFYGFVSQNKKIKAKLKLVGSGPTKAECENLCQQLGINNMVDFCPEVKHVELINFYNSLDLFVLPSHFDGFGCVCLEAYACGVPFMTSSKPRSK